MWVENVKATNLCLIFNFQENLLEKEQNNNDIQIFCIPIQLLSVRKIIISVRKF